MSNVFQFFKKVSVALPSLGYMVEPVFLPLAPLTSAFLALYLTLCLSYSLKGPCDYIGST